MNWLNHLAFRQNVINGFLLPENEDNCNAADRPWIPTCESYSRTNYNKPKIL